MSNDSLLRKQWQGIETIDAVYRCRESAGRTEESQVFFVSNVPCKVRTIAKHLRSHCWIENRLHQVLDATFAEGSVAFAMGTARNYLLTFVAWPFTFYTVKASIRYKGKVCGWDQDAFEKLIAGFLGN